ncbi:inverse autotransporter beta domain-containing protein [uncultured Hoeflea sp.]|uniref:inverse autotransporter beta domain-containing protein n=1 Tax=uncultured Hoeflea sp. TaxID=538666 RepID=UPI0026343909|nr:inverse autotransporter beta domain-containing protein [uncultured Hoeflea sp.]
MAAAGEARDPWKNLRADSDPLKTPEAARVGKSSKAARLETRDATYAVDQQGLNDNLDVLLDRSYGAQTAPEREFTPGIDGLAGDKKWRPHIEFTAAPGDERSLGQINLFAPLMQDGDSLLFTDLRASAWTDNVQEGNFGVGYRQIVPGAFFGNDAILGVYGFFDARRSAFDNMFYQGTLGAELITERFEFRVNGYLPSGNQYVVGTTGSGVALDGFNVVNIANDLVERALPGFDVEAGIKIDFSEAAVRLNAGYFRFERGDTLVEGPRFRAEVEIDDPFGWDGAKLSLGGEVRDDDVRGTEVSGLMRLRVPIGGASDADRADDQLSDLEQLMTRRVYRDDDIVTPVVRGENTQSVSQVTDAASGQTLQAFFVANTAQGAADCSSVANACEFVTAQGLAGAGDTFLPVDVAGNIGSVFTLNADRQQVVGAGTTGSASITLSDAAGSVLVVTSLGGRPIVTGVNIGHFADTRVAGLATNSATGIFGDGMTGTIGIQDVITTDGGLRFANTGATISVTDTAITSNAAIGIELTNYTGPGATFTNTDVTTTTGTGLRLDGGSGGITLDADSSITKSGAGAAVEVVNAHTGTLRVDGSVTVTGGTGLQFNNADGTYNFNGASNLNGGDAGIDILNGSAGTFTFGASTAIMSPTGMAFNVDGSAANVAYQGTIIQNNAANAVSAVNNTGGTVTFSGAVTANTSTATGINLTNNAGATVSFTGGLNIDTTTGTGFSATGGGTVSVAASAGDESIAATAGQALNLNGVTIGAGGVTFDSLSSMGSATTGIDINGVTGGAFTVSGATTVSGSAGNAVQLTGNAAAVNFNGATGITMTAASAGVAFAGTTTGAVTFADLDIALQSDNSTGVSLSGAVINANVTATDFDLTSTTATGTTGIDLSGTTGTGTIRLGDTNAAGASATIAGVNVGVRFTATSNATFIFGDGEGVADKGSAISGTTAIAGGSLVTMGSYDFDDVNFTGILDFAAGAASNLVFVAQTATGDGSGSDVNNRANAATADAITTANTIFVLINDGAAIDDTDGFTLHANQTMASFGNGRTFASSGLVVPANFSGIPGAGPAITDPTGNGAGVLTNSGAGNTLTLLGNDATLQDFEINNAAAGTGLTATGTANISSTGLVVRNVGAQGIDLNNVTGTVTFNNTTVSTTAGNGVDLNNTSATFTGGLNIDTTTGTGFSATGGGTISVAATAGDESITTTSGQALNLNGVTIGGGGVSFDSLSSAGSAAQGINLESVTGGAFTVTGTTSATGSTTEGVRVANSSVAINLGTLNVSGTTGTAVFLNSNTGGSFTVTGGTVTKGGVGLGHAFEIDGGAMAVNFGANISHTSNAGDAVSVRGGTTGNITVSGTIANSAGGRAVNIDTVTGGAISFTGATVTDTTGLQIANVAAGASVSFSAGTAVTVNSPGSTGINLSGNAGAIAFNGAVDINDARDHGILLSNNNANVTFGQLDIELSGDAAAANTDAIAVGGTPGILTFGATTITNVGAASGQKGVDFSGVTLGGAVNFESVAISGPATSTTSIGVDLTGVLGNQVVNLGNQTDPATGPSSSITDLHRGVVIDNTAAVQFTFGDGESGADTGSSINVNGQAGAFTVDAGGGTLGASSFDFNDVAFGAGDNANLPTGAPPVFVSITGGLVAAGVNNLSQGLVTIDVAAAEALADTDQTFVFVGNGMGNIDLQGGGVDGFTLDAGQSIRSFNNGSAISLGIVQPANIEGNFGIAGVTSDDVTAVNNAGGATSVIATAGGGNNTISNLDISTGATGVLINGNTAAVTLSNVGVTGLAGTGLGVSIQGAQAAITLNNVDISGTATGIDNQLGNAAGDVTFDAASSISNTATRSINLDQNASDFTFAGTISETDGTGAGIAINQLGGAAAFSGAVALNTGASNAVSLTTNTGSINFSGGLDIDTTTGTGFTATGGGTIGVSNSGVEQITATGTGTALNLDSVTIAAGGVNFDQVTTAAASTGNGIDINDAAGGPVTLTSVNIGGTAVTTGLDVSGNARTSNVVISGGTIANGAAINGTGAGTVQIGANISTSAGYAVQIANRNGASGAITVGGTVTSGTGAVSLQNNTGGNVTFNGTITGTGSNNAGAINIDATTGGTATFAGLVDIDVTGAGTGVSIANSNAGGTFNFTGGLDINSVNGTGFEALSGTVSVAATANNESVTATAGQAVNLVGVTIGGGGVSFDSLSSAGSAGRGINLESVTGGAFTVTGTTSATGSTTQGVRVASSSAAINLGTLNVSGTTGTAVFLDSNTGGSFTVTAGTVTKGGVNLGDALDINGGAMAVNFGANISHTSNAGDAVSVRGGTTGNITVSGTIANSAGGRSVDISMVTGGAISFTGAMVTDTVGIQILNVAAGASVSFSAGTAVTVNSPSLAGINLGNNAGAIAFNGAVDINNARDGGIRLLGNNANVTFGQVDIELSGGGAAANTDAIAVAGTPGILSFGATTITNVGAAANQKGVDFSGTTTGGTVNFASLNVALVGDNVTALDLSGATIGANMTFGDFDVTSTSATGTVAVNLSGATGAGVVQLGDTNQNGGANVTIGTAANMLATGVQFNAATNLNFTIGDGDGAAGDLTASDIHATIALNGTLPTNGNYNFRDIDFNASGTANLSGPSLYFVDAAGAGTGASQTDAGSIAGAETFTGDVIVLIDTTQNGASDTIDMTAAPHVSGGAANSLDLDDGQVLISLVAGQNIDLSTLGVAATGAPGNFFFTGIAGGTSTVTGAATLDTVAPTLTTNLGNTVNLAGSAGIQSVTLTNTGGGDGINASFGAGENVVIRSSTIGGGAGGEAINIATTAGASTFDFSGLTLSRGVRLNGAGGGTLTGTATGANTIANAAGKGLDLDTVVIGAAGFTFDSVSSTNAGNGNSGIRINNLTGAGGVTITNATVVDSSGVAGGAAIELTGITTTGSFTIDNIDIDLPTTGINFQGIRSFGGHTADINLGTGAGGVAIDDAGVGIWLDGTAGNINIGTGATSGGVQMNTRTRGLILSQESTGTIEFGNTTTASVINAGIANLTSVGIFLADSDASVTVTGIDINSTSTNATAHGIFVRDNDTVGSFTLNGTNTIDNTGGDGIHIENASATISNVTIGGSATGAADDISGAGIRIDNTDATSRTVALSNITMGSGGNGDTGDVAGVGVDINSSGAGILTVNLTGTNVIRSTGQALDVDETAGLAAANNLLLSVNNTTFESAAVGVPSVEVTGQNVSTTASSVGVRGFAGNTVIGNSSTSRGGILFTAVDFDSDGAGGQVAGGTLNIGQSAGARVRGDGLSLIDTTGDLAFTTLNVFNDNGTGLEVNTKGSGTTFNLVNAGGTVNTTNGTALFLDPLTMNLTFGAVTATGGANGVFIDAGDATGGAGSNALTITTLNVTGSTGAGLRINNSTGTFNFGTTTINNTATAGGGVDIDATAGGDTLNVNFTNGLDIDTTSGDGFDANVFVSSTFNLQVANAGTETINTTTGRVLDLLNANTTGAGINFDSLTATGVVNGDVIYMDLESGTFNGGNVTIAGTQANGQNGIFVVGGGGTVNFASATIDNVLGAAVNMQALGALTLTTVDIDGGSFGVTTINSGTLTISGGTIGATTGPTSQAFISTSGTGTVNIAASLSKTSAGNLVFIANRIGGSVTLTGNLSATGAATGIVLQDNAGGTVTFSGGTKTLNTGANAAVSLSTNTGATVNFTGGGLDIDTTTGTGFAATGGGTVTIQGAGNSITSTTGAAVDMQNVTIGGSGITFASISSGGGTNGVLLQHVDGAFTVTGTAALNNSTQSGLNLFNSDASNDGNLTFTANTLNISNAGGGGAFVQRGSGTGRTDFDVTTGTINSGSRTPIFISNSGNATIDLGATFASVSMNGNANGIFINNNAAGGTISGSLNTGTGGTIQNTGGNAVNMNRLSANVTIGQAITTASGGIRVINQVSGTNTFSGVHTLTGAGSGYLFDNNAGGLTNITGNVTASTANGAALTINTSAAHAVTFSGTNTALSTTTGDTVDISAGATVNFNSTGTNTITATGTGKGVEAIGGTLVIGGTATVSTAAGNAVAIQNATIGGAGVTFRSVSANGAGIGILLNNTGAGGFTVTGSGTTNGSGGTITGSTDNVVLTNAASVSLSNMNLQNAGSNAIEANSVNGLTLDNILIDNAGSHGFLGTSITALTLTDSQVEDNGSAASTHGVFITNLLGTSTIARNIFQRNAEVQMRIVNTTATAAAPAASQDITNFTGNTFRLHTGGFFGDNLQIEAGNGANMQVNIGDGTIPNQNTFDTGQDGAHIIAASGGTMDVTINRNTRTNGTGQGFNLQASANSTLTFDVNNNTITDVGSSGINAVHVGTNDATTTTGRIRNNTITRVGQINPGGSGFYIRTIVEGSGTHTVLIDNNTASGGTGFNNLNGDSGIFVRAGDPPPGGLGNLRMDATITNNNVSGAGFRSIEVVAGTSAGGTGEVLCVNISGNTAANGANGDDAIRLEQRNITTFHIQGFAGNGTNETDIVNHLNAQNPASGTVDVRNAAGTVVVNYTAATCNTP